MNSYATIEGEYYGDIGFIEVESIVRDNDGVILYADPLLEYQHIPLESVEIISVVESGPAGPQGPSGADGTPGASAYQSWLNLGNVGTEQDFIDYLSLAAGSDVSVINEVPIGLKNDVNVNYTTAYAFISNSTDVFINGMKQTLNDSYIEQNGNQIVFSEPIWPNATITINYKRTNSTTLT